MFSITSRLNKLNLSLSRCWYPAASCQSVSSSSSSSTRKPTLEETLEIRPKPKKPMTGFLRFCQEYVRPNLLKENPNIRITQITKIASERWKEVNEELKSRLNEDYKRDLQQYHILLSGYKEELAKADQNKLRQFHKESRAKKEKNELKKQRSQLGYPKRPLSSFMLYLQKRKAEVPKPPNQKEFVALVSSEWKNLDETERAKFVALQVQEKAAYDEKKAAWEAEMRLSGNSHLISPKKSSKRPPTQ